MIPLLHKFQELLRKSLVDSRKNEQRRLNPKNHQSRSLVREDVLYLIQNNGGTEGLDLSEYDLSEADLRGLRLSGVIFGKSDF